MNWQRQQSINLNIVECKYVLTSSSFIYPFSINLNIVECKYC